jgi:hypothetical protein
MNAFLKQWSILALLLYQRLAAAAGFSLQSFCPLDTPLLLVPVEDRES